MISKFPMGSVFAALLAVGLLSGCESVDSLNPVEWFDDEEESSSEPKPVPGADGPFPAIGAVPDRPPTPQIARDLDEIEEGLIADKANAKYTDQVIRQRSEPTRNGGAPRAGAAGATASATAPPPAEPPSDPPTASIAAGQAPQSAQPAAPASIFSAPQPQRQAAAPQAARPQPATPQAAAPQPARPQPATPQAATPQPATPQPAAPQAAAPQAATPQPAPAPQPMRATPPPQRAGIAPPSAADLAAAPASPAVAPAATRTANQATTKPAPQPGQVVHLATLYFPNGGASLTAQDRAVLEQVMALYNNGGKQMRVVGHASSGPAASDPARQDLANYKASLDRATAAAGALLELGMPQPAIQIAAVGARQPRFAETSPEGVAGNQRVEIFVRY
ncbi:MAG: OmpA family protein [Alphaproteobacteria bacterium]|nr:OmpA family protein [Alphaproteobacteria bacterium]